MGKIPDDFEDVVKFVATKLSGRQYAIRGTASLVLHGLDFNVQDIDVLTDKETSLFCNKALKEILEKKVEYSESEKHKSYFGKFKVNDVLIEICGNWQIKTQKGDWSEVFDASEDETEVINIDNNKIRVTNMETELKMYMLMGRWNVYHKLRRELEKKKQGALY